MGKLKRPTLYNIPTNRAFADSLVAGIMARYGADQMTLAQGMIVLPNNRASRAISDAFVRKSEGGLLLPRLVTLGDPELGEQVGSALDPVGESEMIPPAVPPMRRRMILARMVQEESRGQGRPVDAGQSLVLADALATVLDQMQFERLSVSSLQDIDLAAELSTHWQTSLAMFDILISRWPTELERIGMIDLADRRNRLFDRLTERWKEVPPQSFVIAAGISTTAPSIAALLRCIADLPKGEVVLAGLDQDMDDESWKSIGPFDPDPVSGHAPRAIESHPQYTFKRLLDRMGVAREDVARWKWGSDHDARAVRSRNISNAMLPPRHTNRWRDLKPGERSLAGVEALEVATSGEEAQVIALALREAMETPGRTAALVTPDRQLATRVSAHLRRWGIEADDSAGQPLSRLPPGTLLIAMAEAAVERFSPISLLTLLKHPLVMKGDKRLLWLDGVRALDQLLRGPRPQAGLIGIDQLVTKREDDRQESLRTLAREWWPWARELLSPLEQAMNSAMRLSDQLAALRVAASALTNDAAWAGHQGHSAAALFAEMEEAAAEGPRYADARALPMLLDHVLKGSSVRPPQGGHPRIHILGLIESRLTQFDLMILSGLNEGTWPGLPSPDPWLAPRIRRELGLPGVEMRIGFSAHDLSSALGAPQVLLTRAKRGSSGPAIASRFWLRIKAMTGSQFKTADRYLKLAQSLDSPSVVKPVSRPMPSPPASVRPTLIPVTDVDRLKADPFAFYAKRILRLLSLEPVDADAGPAWRGTAVHEILQQWAENGRYDPADLERRARELFTRPEVHPLLRALWQPRLIEAIRWIGEEVANDRREGRRIKAVEIDGKTDVAGVTLTGKADRIDMLADGSLAIIDYKTGKPPSGSQVQAGYALQLGLLGLIAEQGGFAGLEKHRKVSDFEYWSLAKKKDIFGYRESPVDSTGKKKSKIATDAFTEFVHDQFQDVADKWLTGMEPFIAQLNPEVANYGEYDQLMRLEEWYGRDDG